MNISLSTCFIIVHGPDETLGFYRDALGLELRKVPCTAFSFRTDDLDATFEKVRASGAEVLQEPTDQFWGVRDCVFRDPSGT